MKICVVTDVPLNESARLPPCDAAVFGFDSLGEVDYESELSGKTDKFGELARLSKKAQCSLFCGCKTDSRGLKRISVAAADRGKLLGISDMMHVIDAEEYKSGGTLGFYNAGGYKVGLCIENDLYFPENAKALSMCGCNVVLVLMEEVKDNLPPLLIRAYSYLYGVPHVLCAGKYSYFADITGAIATSSQKITAFETDPKNCYRVVTERRRGLFCDFSADY